MPRVKALCVGPKKGEPKRPVPEARFRAGHGIEGDAHAGPWHRQVSLLADEDIQTVRRAGFAAQFTGRWPTDSAPQAGRRTKVRLVRRRAGLPDIPPGAFAENIVLSGLDLGAVGLGTRLRLGEDVVLAVTQIGKVCHAPCEIARVTGDCIMPRLGLFARVEKGGSVRPGDEAELIAHVPRERLQAVVLTVSDRCSRGEAADTAGPAVARLLEERLGAHLYRLEVIPDEADRIAGRLAHYADGHSIDLVATVGGTGFAPRDVTPEATRRVVERPTPGLDEAMRAASLSKTPHAALSRGSSGIRGSTLLLNLPGSERAARENLEAILDALGHGLAKLRGDASDCGRPPKDAPHAPR